MSVLDRKLVRDLWSQRGQVLTIALLVATGVTVLVGSVSTYVSLLGAQEAYYRESRFADVWADVKRAPRSLVGRIAEIPGMGTVEARIVEDVRVAWPRSPISVSGRLVSIPDRGQPELNRLRLAKGRWIDTVRRDEILISAAFAEAWAVEPGEPVDVILNGRIQRFHVAGIAYSPEYIYASPPGNPLPDDRAFVVLWAGENAIAAAFDMEGAFNNLTLSLAPEASPAAVIADLDRILDSYGAPGAYERRDQPSNRFLSDELAEQRTLAIAVPLIFFGIASFLLNIVLGRLVSAQREQIAALKALGFPSLPVGLHYVKFVGILCALGAAAGILVGIRYGQGMMNNYRPFFRFPDLDYVFPAWLPLSAVAASFAAAAVGALAAVRRVLGLRPAEAMRPATPHAVRLTLPGLPVGPVPKMVLRSLFGRPLRSALTVVGLAFAVPMGVLGLFWWDALDSMVEIQFEGIQRGDAAVTFTDPVPSRAIGEIRQIPGVLAAEGRRTVAVRLRSGHRTYRIGLTGLAQGAELSVPRDRALRALPLPPDGIMISTALADRLGVKVGSLLTIEALEGQRPVRELPVAALVDDLIGFSAYMERSALNRLMHEGDLVTDAALRVDPLRADEVWQSLSERPKVVSTSVKSSWLRVFDETIRGMVAVSAAVLTLFGLLIAVGVVYNSARIAFQERVWELASLRILGFSRAQVSRILFAELGVQILVAIPLGLVLAQGFVALLLGLRDNETFRIPPVIGVSTYASAALTVLAAGFASAFLVRRRIDRLDLVGALKARD
ncbi:ABC transporter permease [Microvirga thermotolerans]|uniref:ABC transporter permease n=1 Tax=Microvirga thermotolerans TaxID=2651334 RepID=UPI001FE7C94F|nr:ABC transporter permease [Microvirga thermotolerans]